MTASLATSCAYRWGAIKIGAAMRRYFVSTRATSRGTMLNSLPVE